MQSATAQVMDSKATPMVGTLTLAGSDSAKADEANTCRLAIYATFDADKLVAKSWLDAVITLVKATPDDVMKLAVKSNKARDTNYQCKCLSQMNVVRKAFSGLDAPEFDTVCQTTGNREAVLTAMRNALAAKSEAFAERKAAADMAQVLATTTAMDAEEILETVAAAQVTIAEQVAEQEQVAETIEGKAKTIGKRIVALCTADDVTDWDDVATVLAVIRKHCDDAGFAAYNRMLAQAGIPEDIVLAA